MKNKKKLFSSLHMVIICVVLLLGVTWAWFSERIEVSDGTITAASYGAKVEISSGNEGFVEQTGTTFNVDNGKAYDIRITATGTAPNGYSVISADSLIWHTVQMSPDNAIVLKAKFPGTGSTEIKVEPSWGTYSDTQNAGDEVDDGDVLINAVITPVITIETQPVSATVLTGESAALNVAATVTENAVLSYQWYQCTATDKTGATAIENATDATYNAVLSVPGSAYFFCKVSAEGAESVDTDVVSLTAPVIFAENFDSSSFAVAGWGAVNGIAKAGNSVLSVITDDVDNTDKKLKINAITEDLPSDSNIDARFGSGTTWADATSTTDRSAQRITYEFDLELTADSGTTLYVMLRSVNSGAKMSYLARIVDNVLSIGSANLTQTLTTGTYKFQFVCDFATKTHDVYVNGVIVTDDGAMQSENTFYPQAVNDLLRFNVKPVTNTFNIDNISIYEVDSNWIPANAVSTLLNAPAEVSGNN